MPWPTHIALFVAAIAEQEPTPGRSARRRNGAFQESRGMSFGGLWARKRRLWTRKSGLGKGNTATIPIGSNTIAKRGTKKGDRLFFALTFWPYGFDNVLMARFARVVLTDLPYHVTHRGNRRDDVFFTPIEGTGCETDLAESCERERAKLLRHVLHARPQSVPLSRRPPR